MTRAPYLVPGRTGELRYGHVDLKDSLLHDGLWDPFEDWAMGNAADFIAEEYEVTREAMDKFAAESQQKAVAAIEAGKFKDEIVPVEVPGRKGAVTIFDTDEGPRAGTTAEGLAKLQPVFRKDGRVTAGNASTLNDGAAAVVVCQPCLRRSPRIETVGARRCLWAGCTRTEMALCRSCQSHAESARKSRLDTGRCRPDRTQRSFCCPGVWPTATNWPTRAGIGTRSTSTAAVSRLVIPSAPAARASWPP